MGDCAWKGGPPSLSQSPSAAFVTPVTGRKHFAEPSHGVNCPEAVFVYSPLDSVSSEVVPLCVIYLSATVCCASPQPSMFPEYVPLSKEILFVGVSYGCSLVSTVDFLSMASPHWLDSTSESSDPQSQMCPREVLLRLVS